MKGIIRARRRELGMTQEQMAQRLGVSAGAVSKWEQGTSYPDIALLPALARLLRTDINTLMGYEQMLTREDAAQMASQVVEMTKDAGIDAAFALAQEMARTYPDSGALLYMLAATLEGRMIMRGMNAEERERYSAVLEGWYERASACEDAQIRESAAHLLASKYLTRGEMERARAMMEKLPPEPTAA
ncbi:MAG: helix-turn-helix transcriptional regulator, partial [Eubacteriales bacterium]|nr:helix-turn-helix transcriptional regulator [Eubacteriales bacterium]